jgi:hypothetical protein
MDATPNNSPAVPMIAVEPVLMFRASCACGWWKVVGADEDTAKDALLVHMVASRCDGCGSSAKHDDLRVQVQSTWAGAFCARCAPSYAAA